MANRKRMAAANWKMFKTGSEAKAFFEALRKEDVPAHVGVIVCPPFTAMEALKDAVKGTSIAIGGQNLHWEEKGAFTGEISGAMLREAGATYCVVGHSERRQLFGETDETVNRRLKACVREKLIPILCVGETLPQRDSGKTEEIVRGQLAGGLEGIPAETVRSFVIAYEPVWAIGTGRNATPEQAQEVHACIRALLRERDGSRESEVPILYGGSVKPDNIAVLMKGADVDGALIGGAALDPGSFAAIARGAGN